MRSGRAPTVQPLGREPGGGVFALYGGRATHAAAFPDGRSDER
jgi:hypothetical protein